MSTELEVIAKKEFTNAEELSSALNDLVNYSGRHGSEVLIQIGGGTSSEDSEARLLKRRLTDGSHVFDIQLAS